MDVNFLDVIILLIFLYTVLRGIVAGLIREVVSVAGLILGAILAHTFYERLAAFVARVWNGEHLALLCYVLLFGLVFVGCILIGAALRKGLELTMLAWIDRVAGGLLGLLKGILFSSVLLFSLTVVLSPRSTFITGSKLAPYVNKGAVYVAHFVPAELTRSFREKSKHLKDQWKNSLFDKLLHPEKWDEE